MNKLFLVRDIIGLSLLPSPPFPPLRFRFVSKKPPSPIPRIPPKLHPNVQLNAPAPRIESRIFLLLKAQGDGASNFPHHLKVATPSVSVALSPFEGVRLAAGGAIASPSGGPGGLPPANLCLLSFRKKVGRGAGRSARSWGVQRGLQPPRISRAAGALSLQNAPPGKPPTKCKPKPIFNRKNKTGGKPYGLQTGRSNDD